MSEICKNLPIKLQSQCHRILRKHKFNFRENRSGKLQAKKHKNEFIEIKKYLKYVSQSCEVQNRRKDSRRLLFLGAMTAILAINPHQYRADNAKGNNRHERNAQRIGIEHLLCRGSKTSGTSFAHTGPYGKYTKSSQYKQKFFFHAHITTPLEIQFK